MKKDMNKWDKKADTYTRYSQDKNTLENTICGYIADMGIDFNGKSVLDIGCGTGIYTLHISKKASHIDALDYSMAMLHILDNDARSIKVHNIKTHHCTWNEYLLPNQKYDIALSTMSPATKEADEFDKMTKSAKTKIFLGWGNKRGTELMDQLFEVHGTKYYPPNGAKRLKEWLDSQNIRYKVKLHEETKSKKNSIEKALLNYKWHLEARGIVPDVKKMREVLTRFIDHNGDVREKTVSYLNLIIW